MPYKLIDCLRLVIELIVDFSRLILSSEWYQVDGINAIEYDSIGFRISKASNFDDQKKTVRRVNHPEQILFNEKLSRLNRAEDLKFKL